MRTKTTLSVLELIRRADQADAAQNTAHRTLKKAEAATAEASARATAWTRQLARTTSPALQVLSAWMVAVAQQHHAEWQAHEEAADAKWARALTRAAKTTRTWKAAFTAHGWQLPDAERASSKDVRAAATAQLLGPLAEAPLELVKTAHAILIQSSAGKDSVVTMHRIVQWAKAVGCLHKLVVVHADLGDAEWRGVKDLAQRQAERYGIPFVVVAAEGGFIGMVEQRGQWPDAKRRLCTVICTSSPR